MWTLITRSPLKNWILVQGQGGGEFQPAGAQQEVPLGCIRMNVEDLEREPNADIGPTDIFQIASGK